MGGTWTIHGRAYDLEPMMHAHPGGERILDLTRGTDCTALFESYHAFSDAPRESLSRYGPPYAGSGVDPLLEDVHRAAHAVFDSRAATKAPVLVTAALCLAQCAALTLMLRTLTTWSAVIYGLVLATCATRVIHECSHNAAFLSPRLNAALGELVAAPLLPFAAWYISHNLSHHPHTSDPTLDIDVALLRRFCTGLGIAGQLITAAIPVPVRIGVARLVPWTFPARVVLRGRRGHVGFRLKTPAHATCGGGLGRVPSNSGITMG